MYRGYGMLMSYGASITLSLTDSTRRPAHFYLPSHSLSISVSFETRSNAPSIHSWASPFLQPHPLAVSLHAASIQGGIRVVCERGPLTNSRSLARILTLRFFQASAYFLYVPLYKAMKREKEGPTSRYFIEHHRASSRPLCIFLLFIYLYGRPTITDGSPLDQLYFSPFPQRYICRRLSLLNSRASSRRQY